MSGVSQLALLFIGAALINNILLTRFIGLCPFFGVSGNMETSIGMSLSVIFVMVMASTATWVVWEFILDPLGVGEFLYIPAFILIIASLVQFVEMYLRKASPVLYRAMGIYLPLITTNCAVLATATEAAKPGFFKMNIALGASLSLGEALVYTLGVSVGFGFALITFAALRERLELVPAPRLMKGTPIAFITAGLLSLSYLGMSGWFGL
ncbi:MAG: Electron transport complex protein RnfA [Actinobacteria bacterium 66_15]|jgi:electron transport complex protein RnfA|uniref:electron transport complex protein RnfA n=1 Tax=Anaerosoma tenue TaxID=2933588 RepID=UPI00076C5F91|nr:Rnf-Nqr domain containing protein [Anaerosoma tenue]KUK48285.1 MAG: Electron transport complex protein RnfA [Actinobacteria bacterium 66_15]